VSRLQAVSDLSREAATGSSTSWRLPLPEREDGAALQPLSPTTWAPSRTRAAVGVAEAAVTSSGCRGIRRRPCPGR
jgi:hypothetical protein